MLQSLGSYFIPLLCGYWFLTHCNFTKFHTLRESGYHVLFRSAIAGLGLFAFSYLVLRIVNHVFPTNQTILEWRNWIPIENSVALTITIFISACLPLVFNCFYDEIRSARKVAKRNGDFIELLIDQSLNDILPVEVSLRSGKSYIGYVIESQLAQQSEVDIVLVPIASGYRKLETRELEITIHYSSIILEFENKDITDFRIVIPMSEIVSARLFDDGVYERFQDE